MNIEAKDLSKVYNSGENRVVALDHANLEIVSYYFLIKQFNYPFSARDA